MFAIAMFCLVLTTLCFTSGCISKNKKNNSQQEYSIVEEQYVLQDAFNSITICGGSALVDLIVDDSVTQTTVHVKKQFTVDSVVKVGVIDGVLTLEEKNKRSSWSTFHNSGQVEYAIITPFSVDIKAEVGVFTIRSKSDLQNIKTKTGTVVLELIGGVKNITIESGTTFFKVPAVFGNIWVKSGTLQGTIGVTSSSEEQSISLKTGTIGLMLIVPLDTYVPLGAIQKSPAIVINSSVSASQGRNRLDLMVKSGAGQITIVSAQ